MDLKSDHIVIANKFGKAIFSPWAGASLRSLKVISADDTAYELLSGGEGPHDPLTLEQGTGSFMMCPWPGRLKKGILFSDGEKFQMPINRPPFAIHGLTRDEKWTIVNADNEGVQMCTGLKHPWPGKGRVTFNARLFGSSLVMSLEIVNYGDNRFPVAIGWHPWFNSSLGDKRLTLSLPGQESEWKTDPDGNANGFEEQISAHLDLRQGMIPGEGVFDHCFRVDPLKPAEIEWEEAIKLTVKSSSEMDHIVVYSPQGSVCVEPLSSTIDAFRLASEGINGTGSRYLDPGCSFYGSTSWSWI